MISNLLNEKIIRRDFYIDKIKVYLNSPIVKVITWMRRVWKSFILKSIIQELVNNWQFLSENIFYVNKEDLDFDDVKNYLDLNNLFNQFLKDKDISQSKVFIWIDEIQEIQGWEKFINSCLSKYYTQVEIFITWSNSNILSWELASLLTWRFIEFEIFCLSLEEYAIFRKQNISNQLFMDYLKYWWLPGNIYMQQDQLIIFNYLKWVYSTILLKDIVKHFWLRNIDFFENLYKYLLSNVGNIFTAKNISDFLKSQKIKISTETVLNYINYWLKSYLIYQVKSTDPITKKFFEIYNKYYVWDLWIRNSLTWFNLAKDMWSLLENYVFLELKRNQYEVKIGKLDKWQEIDFVVEKNWIKKYLQVTYKLNWESTIQREFGNLELIKDNWEKYVISMDDIDFGIRNWIKHINIFDLKKIL